MICSTRQVGVYAYGAPVDMRKGFFANRPRTRAKALMWGGTACALTPSDSRKGGSWLWREEHAATLPLTMSELHLFLEGSVLVGRLTLQFRDRPRG